MEKKIFISKKVAKHASFGDFYRPLKKNRKFLLRSGGHGQENIDFLKRRKTGHGVDTLYSNGVRLGHISIHKDKRKRRPNGHAWFPAFWTREDMKNAAQHVASLKRNRPLANNTMHTGRYRGVSVGVFTKEKRIQTICPDFNVNRHARKKSYQITDK